MDRKIFNKVYAKFSKKDYFSNKGYVRTRIKEAKFYAQNFTIIAGEVKGYLKKQKEKSYISTSQRVIEYNNGKIYPQREQFTWAIIKELEKQKKVI